MIEITYKQISELFKRPRSREANKGDFGRVLVVAGSMGMAGAAILCAKGALRAGAGLVTVSVPNELLSIVQTAVPEAICIKRPGGGAYDGGDNLSTVLSPQRLAAFDSIVMGPGLGASYDTLQIVMHVLENYGGKLVLDADALNVLVGSGVSLDMDTIITPHPGEAARLLGVDAPTIQSRREASAAILSEKYGCMVILKGSGTIVAATNPSLKLYINTTGNPGMATGGSGDVLSGVLAAFLGQGMDTETAACAGVYIHGLAGDLMVKEYGESGLIAGDLPLGVARTIKFIAGTL